MGVLGRRIFVSSTDGVYTFAGSDRRFSTAVLPHTILRFVPWGERLWGETHGGVLLWDDGAWHRHPWSSKVADQDHAFARVATFKDLAWGSFGRQILQWDPRSKNVPIEDGRPRITYGLWVPVGLPLQEEIESALALSETVLILGTAAGRIHRREGSATRLLGELPGVNGDPLLLDLARDADGVIWGLAVEGARLARIDSEGLQVVPRGAPGEEDALPQGTLLRLMADPRGRIAVLSEDHGVFRLEGAAWTCIAAAPGERAIDMTFQEDAVVLLTQRRLLRVQGQSREELFVFAPEEPPEPGAP